MTTNFKIGDTVRLTGKLWDETFYARVGDIVTIAGIDTDGDPWFHPSGGGTFYIYTGYEAELVEDRQGENGEYVPVDEHLFIPIKQAEKIAIKAPEAVPPVGEYRDPRHEALLREINDQAAVIRRRNETIESLNKELETARSYGEILAQAGIGSFLEGIKVVEAGARLLALGISFDDIQRWRNQEIAEEMRILRRINDRKKLKEEV